VAARHWQPGPVFAAVAVAAIVGTVMLAALPLGFVLGDHPFWHHPTGDTAMAMTGGAFFVADRWRLPLLFVPALGAPGGTNIAFTDSIPLAAIAARLLRQASGLETVYVPAWIALCYLLQGPAAIAALAAAGVRRAGVLVPAGLLAVLLPFYLQRFGHPALNGQFIILLAIALHLAAGRGAAPARLLAGYAGLATLAVLIHPYFAAMVLAVQLMTLLDGVWQRRLGAGGAALALAATVATVAAVAALCGYFGAVELPFKSYGDYAFDLASPFLPRDSGLLPSATGPVPGGGESYSYVGAGLLALSALAASGLPLRAIWARHGGSLLVLALLLVFAASYGLFAGGRLLLGLSPATMRDVFLAVRDGAALPAALAARLDGWDRAVAVAYPVLVLAAAVAFLVAAWRDGRRRFVWTVLAGAAAATLLVAAKPGLAVLVVSNFRGSARFAWIAIYLWLVIAVAIVARRRGAALMLAGCLVLQALDARPLLQALAALPAAPPAGRFPDEAAIAAAAAAADRVEVVPTYLCAFATGAPGAARDRLVDRIVELQWLAAVWHRPVNSVRNARMSIVKNPAIAAPCRDDAAAAAGRPPAGTLRLRLEDATPAEAAAASGCRPFSAGLLCEAGSP